MEEGKKCQCEAFPACIEKRLHPILNASNLHFGRDSNFRIQSLWWQTTILGNSYAEINTMTQQNKKQLEAMKQGYKELAAEHKIISLSVTRSLGFRKYLIRCWESGTLYSEENWNARSHRSLKIWCCSVCGNAKSPRLFSEKRLFVKHTLRKHARLFPQEEIDIILETNLYSCVGDGCEATFADLVALKEHILACPEC